MPEQSRTPYHFGDLLALAREQWVRQMAEQVRRAGFDDYRRIDASLLRLLSRRPRSIGEIGAALGVTRQAARKFVTRLEQHGYAVTRRDVSDARQVNVELTPRGDHYASDSEHTAEQLEVAVVVEDSKAALGCRGGDQIVAGREPPLAT